MISEVLSAFFSRVPNESSVNIGVAYLIVVTDIKKIIRTFYLNLPV